MIALATLVDLGMFCLGCAGAFLAYCSLCELIDAGIDRLRGRR